MRHLNSNITEQLNRTFNFKGGATIDEINETITPTVKVRNPCNFIKNNTRVVTGTGTVVTTDTDRDTYITGVLFGMIKDAACDAVTGSSYVTAVVNGTTIYLAILPSLTLTAQNDSVFVDFSENPVKIDRGTSINTVASGAYAAGLMCRSCVVYGYTIDTLKGP